MKPKDLKPIFTFEARRPFFDDSVFYVPLYYQQHDASLLPSLDLYFSNGNPRCIEYCSGNGDWILEKASQASEKNWIAVEKRFDRVRKIWSKMKNRQIDNLLIVCGEAHDFTKNYLQTDTIEEVYINFPDPWPKMKHAKHRLIQKSFLDEVARVLKKEKDLTLVTDDALYMDSVLKQLSHHPKFQPVFPAPFFTTQILNYGTSWFEELWRKKGRNIHYTQYRKK